MNSAPFFIIGSGRSGSTLLRVILASHSRLAIPPETWFLLPLLRRRFETERPLSATELESVVDTITGHYRWADMKLPASEFRRRAHGLAQPDLRSVIELIYQDHVRREHKYRWGDKTPGYMEIVPQLTRLFPGSQFIHLCRDGRDVAKSFQKTGWYGPWLHDNTSEWNEALDYRNAWSSLDINRRILDVRYEDLVVDTENTVMAICNFLEEQFEDQMRSWRSQIDHLIPPRERQIHHKLKRRPLPSDVNRWRYEMTAREVFVCEAFMGARLERAGYERDFEGCPWTPFFLLTRWYCIALSAITKLPLKISRHLRRRLRPAPTESYR